MKINSVTPGKGGHLVQVGKGFQFVNRATARKRVVDRKFTKKGYAFGRLMDGAEDRAIERIAKRQRDENK